MFLFRLADHYRELPDDLAKRITPKQFIEQVAYSEIVGPPGIDRQDIMSALSTCILHNQQLPKDKSHYRIYPHKILPFGRKPSVEDNVANVRAIFRTLRP